MSVLYNHSRQMTHAPAWCASVPAAPAPYSVIKPDLSSLWEGETGAEIFARRNIFAPRELMFFL